MVDTKVFLSVAMKDLRMAVLMVDALVDCWVAAMVVQRAERWAALLAATMVAQTVDRLVASMGDPMVDVLAVLRADTKAASSD